MIFFLFTPLFFALSETRTIYFGTSRGNKRVDFSDLPKQNGKNLLNDFSAWYYVHLDSKTVNFESVSQKFQNLFLEKNMISKNIYQLYLSQKQIRELAENGILDVQELSSSDKVYVDIDSQYHTVGVHDSYQLEENPHLYKVISKSAPGYYVVELSQNHKNDAISFLSNLKGVNLLTNYVEKAPINNYAAGFTQNNDQPLSSDKQSIPRYLEGKGISGKGQVVTVFDTPIDVFHADFYDEKKEVAFNTVDNDHRKIVYYGYKGGIEELKNEIQDNEHGTHVAGIVAGKSACSDNLFNKYDGVAPEAKIAYAGNIKTYDGPQNITTIMNNVGSKISTNSWGGIERDPTLLQAWGSLAYDNPDKLFVFGAGNNGEKSSSFSILDPGTSKNVLSVGALDSLYDTPKRYILTGSGQAIQLESLVPLVFSDEGVLGVNIVVGNGDDDAVDICNIMANKTKTGIAYTSNQTALIEKLKKCQSKEYKALFMTYDATVLQLVGKSVQLQLDSTLNTSKFYNVASYSSVGPAFSGILKPEILAPGTRIISANSKSKKYQTGNFGCSQDDYAYIVLEGTSMATPNAAGAAVLVRQYFTDRKWMDTPRELDGKTLRALLIASASNKRLLGNNNVIDRRTGFGAIDLSKVLSFDASDSGISISKSDSQIPSQSHYSAQIIASKTFKSRRLSFVLTYLDPETSVDSVIPIYNDLDLVVTSPSGKRYIGNNNDIYGNNTDAYHFSTSEKIVLEDDLFEDGLYTIHVYSDSFQSAKSVPFSVVVSGPVQSQELVFTPNKQCDCDDVNGTCTENGKCQCDESHIGNHCQVEVEEITEVSLFNVTIGPHQVKYFKLKMDGNGGTVTVTRPDNQNGQYSSFWFSKECHNTLSEYENVVYLSETKASGILESSDYTCGALFNNYPEEQTFTIEARAISYPEGLIVSVAVGLTAAIVVIISLIRFLTPCCRNQFTAREDTSATFKSEMSGSFA